MYYAPDFQFWGGAEGPWGRDAESQTQSEGWEETHCPEVFDLQPSCGGGAQSGGTGRGSQCGRGCKSGCADARGYARTSWIANAPDEAGGSQTTYATFRK